MIIRKLEIDLSLNTVNLTKGLANGHKQLVLFSDDFSRKLGNLPTANATKDVDNLSKALKNLDTTNLDKKSSSKGNDAVSSANSMVSSILPLAGQIQSGIKKAVLTLENSLRRMMSTISQQLNAQFHFTKMEGSITNMREFWKSRLRQMEMDKAAFDAKMNRTGIAPGLTAPVYKPIPAFKNDLKHSDMARDLAGDRLGSALLSDSRGQRRGKSQIIVSGAAAAEAGLMSVKGATDAVTTSLKSMAGEAGLALGVFALTYKAVDMLKQGVVSAANLGETISKVETVFGESTQKIIAQSNQMAKAFGLPKQALLDSSASFGLIAKASGKDSDGAALLSSKMTQLAADTSSFFNIPLSTALEKIRSGLVGEAEPMRALGVLMSDTAVKDEALRLGLSKSGEELSENAKLTARASLITKGLADANGDLDRTQNSGKNQMRKFSGSIDNLATSIGTVLLPALETGMTVLNEFMTYLTDEFEKNKQLIESWGQTIKTNTEIVGVVWRNMADMWTIVSLTVIQGLNNIIDYFMVLGPNVVQIAEYIANNWVRLLSDMVNASIAILTNLGTNFQSLATAIGNWLADPTQGFKVSWTPLLDGFKATADALPELIKPALTDMSKEIEEAAQRIVNRESERVNNMKPKGPLKKGVLNENLKDKDKKNSKNKKEETLAEALTVGSKDAYSFAAEQISGTSSVEKNTATTAKNTDAMRKHLSDLAKKRLMTRKVAVLK